MSTKTPRKPQRSLRVRQAAAQVAVTASKKTGDILPREVYKLAGVSAPEHATDELQHSTR